MIAATTDTHKITGNLLNPGNLLINSPTIEIITSIATASSDEIKSILYPTVLPAAIIMATRINTKIVSKIFIMTSLFLASETV